MDAPLYGWNFPTACLDTALEAVFSPMWKWPKTLRRIAVCVYPLTLLLRAVAGFVLLIAIRLTYFGWCLWLLGNAVWEGKQPRLP